MLEFFGGSPVWIDFDYLKTDVITYPRHEEIILNDSYLSFAKYYQVAIMSAQVKSQSRKHMLRDL